MHKKRGRPPRDFSDEVGKQYGFLRIDALEGHKNGRQLVRTTCLVLGCGKVTIKRLDKLKDGTTVSCGCRKQALHKAWVDRQVSEMEESLRAQIWSDAQIMRRKDLVYKYRRLRPTVVDAAVRLEQSRRFPKPLPTSTNEKEDGIDELDSWDLICLGKLESLKAAMHGAGFGEGKRQFPIFSKDELRFKKNGEMMGTVAYVWEWATTFRSRADDRTLRLIDWLAQKIQETRDWRKVNRAKHAKKRDANGVDLAPAQY